MDLSTSFEDSIGALEARAAGLKFEYGFDI